jgi:hypothetical protein
MKINTIERGVLERLVEGWECDHNFCYSNFNGLCTELALERKLVRRACRSLARKGLAEYGRGLWKDDGGPAGSGYCATQAGADWLGSELLP